MLSSVRSDNCEAGLRKATGTFLPSPPPSRLQASFASALPQLHLVRTSRRLASRSRRRDVTVCEIHQDSVCCLEYCWHLESKPSMLPARNWLQNLVQYGCGLPSVNPPASSSSSGQAAVGRLTRLSMRGARETADGRSCAAVPSSILLRSEWTAQLTGRWVEIPPALLVLGLRLGAWGFS